MKKLLKWAAVLVAAVFGLGLGRIAASHVNAAIPPANWASLKVRTWLMDATTFLTALVTAVVATKITARIGFFGKGGGVSVSK